MKSRPELTFPSGNLEQFSTARHYLGFYNNVGLTATYSHPSSTTPLSTLIFQALRTVIQQHSILSAIPLAEDSQTPYFARLPTIDLRTCVRFVERKNFPLAPDSDDEELDALVSEEHNKDFKSQVGERPFWSLIVLHVPGSTTHFSASWIFHHGLADGTSGLVFHQSLLAALQSHASADADSADRDADPIVTSPKTRLLPPLEDLHPLPLSLWYLAKQQWNDWFPHKSPTCWLGNKVAFDKNTPPIRHFKSLVFSKDITTSLRDASRMRNSSVTAILQCIIAAAVFANLDAQKWKTLRVACPISLRRYLKLDPEQGNIEEQLGVYVSSYTFDHHRQEKGTEPGTNSVLDLFSWDETQALKQGLADEVSKNLKDSIVGLTRWIPDMHQFLLKSIGKDRAESFEFSNVGVVKIPFAGNPEGWKLDRCVFSQSADVREVAFGVSAVTGGDGCLVLGFSWMDGVVEDGWINKVMKESKEGVEGLVG